MFPIFFIIKLVVLALGALLTFAGIKNWSWVYMIAVPRAVSKTLGKDMTRIAMIGTGVGVMLLAVWAIF
ncbi:MAG: hypothetical protein H6581_02225 [Bacteroidia bacterium]|nr:hypothetical protein [Bacteroidia bacterium]